MRSSNMIAIGRPTAKKPGYGKTGKTIEENAVSLRPPARWERNAPSAPISGKKIFFRQAIAEQRLVVLFEMSRKPFNHLTGPAIFDEKASEALLHQQAPVMHWKPSSSGAGRRTVPAIRHEAAEVSSSPAV